MLSIVLHFTVYGFNQQRPWTLNHPSQSPFYPFYPLKLINLVYINTTTSSKKKILIRKLWKYCLFYSVIVDPPLPVNYVLSLSISLFLLYLISGPLKLCWCSRDLAIVSIHLPSSICHTGYVMSFYIQPSRRSCHGTNSKVTYILVPVPYIKLLVKRDRVIEFSDGNVDMIIINLSYVTTWYSE